MQPEWTVDQVRYIEWVATPRFTRTPPTVEMLAAEMGVDRVTLWRWSKEDGFQDEVNKLARAGLAKALPTMYGALIREAEAGSYQHLQLAFEMVGEYTKTQKNLNQSDIQGSLTIAFVEAETAPSDE